ncbi:hypothetical protein SAMN04487866_11018 [Thermoactinomyces sp. DSM 45891]|nr:hypothetical protein SAMN04487866_11018 [Thermoactinomyces sp. DSM 45891]
MHMDAIWRSWDESTLEHLSFDIKDTQIIASSVITATSGVHPICISYHLICDKEWRIREVSLLVSHEEQPRFLHLLSDGEGNWSYRDGGPIEELEGCIDIDLSISPFTNILPIRRLHFPIRPTNSMPVVYIDVPSLSLERGCQRYTHLKRNGPLVKYSFENLYKGFTKEFWVDEHGLVIDYPGSFRRKVEVEVEVAE